MSFRSTHEQLISARKILNLKEDAGRLQVEAHIASMRASGEAMIGASQLSIQPGMREALDECQADYDEERLFGWSLDGANHDLA